MITYRDCSPFRTIPKTINIILNVASTSIIKKFILSKAKPCHKIAISKYFCIHIDKMENIWYNTIKGVDTPFISVCNVHKFTKTNYLGGCMTIGEIAVIRTGLVTVREKKKISSSQVCEYRVVNLKCIADEGYINKKHIEIDFLM